MPGTQESAAYPYDGERHSCASSGDGERRASYRPGVPIVQVFLSSRRHGEDRPRRGSRPGVARRWCVLAIADRKGNGARRSPRLTTHLPKGEWVRLPMPPRRTVAGQPAGGREAPINTPERP
jgi:hypothetical protein